MTIVAIVDTVLLAVALVYIVALLRSHADILRRLSALEDGRGGAGASAGRAGSHGAGAGAGGAAAGWPGAGAAAGPARPPGSDVVPAVDIAGATPQGDSVKLSLGAGSPATLLAFLSTGCATCEPLWTGLAQPGAPAALGERVVIVTHDPDRESPSRLRRLAPPGVDIVMADAAWRAYKVPASPHFVLTDGGGGIAGRGSALSWSQLLGMIGDARADAALEAADAAPPPAPVVPVVPVVPEGEPAAPIMPVLPGAPPVRTTAERAERADDALARAGIVPGHSSLYPNGSSPE